MDERGISSDDDVNCILKLSTDHKCHEPGPTSMSPFIGRNDRVSSISRLPLELLQEIFIRSLPDETFISPDVSESPLKLGLVCRTWRKGSLACPWLWASISIVVYFQGSTPPDPPDTSYIRRLYGGFEAGVEQWIGRSGSLPLSIRYVQDEGSRCRRRRGRPSHLRVLVNSFVPRCQNLHIGPICSVPPDFLFLRPGQVQTPHLKRLALSFSTEGKLTLNLAHLNGLYSLQLRKPWLPDPEVFVLPYDLKRLCIDGISFNAASKVLRDCPSLTTAHFTSIRGYRFTAPPAHATLPHLEELFLPCIKFQAADFWDALTLPSLKVLHAGSPPSGEIPSLLVRSGCKLEHLLYSGIDVEDIISCLSASPMLQHLTIRYRSSYGRSFRSMLSSILDRLLTKEGRSNFTLCPTLRKLSILSSEPIDSYLDYVVNFISTRWSAEAIAADQSGHNHVKEIEVTCINLNGGSNQDDLLRGWDSYFEDGIGFQQGVAKGYCINLTIGSSTYFYGPSCCSGKGINAKAVM